MLTISIPTYNREKIISSWLQVHAKFLNELNVQILIHDNSSPDDTKRVVKEYSNKFPNITLHQSSKTLSAPINVHKSIFSPSTKYVWPMSDSYQIDRDITIELLSLLEENPALVSFNLKKLSKNFSRLDLSKDYYKTLPELAGVLTCLGTTVFSQKALQNLHNRTRYITDFPMFLLHTDIAFSHIGKNGILWIGDLDIKMLQAARTRKNWVDGPQALNVALTSWRNSVDSLPIDNNSKHTLYKAYGDTTKLYRFYNLLRMRKGGALNFSTLIEFHKDFRVVAGVSIIKVALACCIPFSLAALLVDIGQIIKKIYLVRKSEGYTN